MPASEERFRDIDPRSPRDDSLLPSEPQVPLPAMYEVMASA